MQIVTWIEQATKKLNDQNEQKFFTSTPRLDAELLLAKVLGKTRTWLLTWADRELVSEDIIKVEQLLLRRLLGEPIAYILGEKSFWSLSLKVSPCTLIPRPDTERLIEAVLALDLPETGVALDLGTGTGAIALALAKELPAWELIGIDYNIESVKLAQENARLNNIDTVAFRQGNWFDTIARKFHLIVCNPPYIDEKDDCLNEGDIRFEPHSALTSGEKGLQDIRIICSLSPRYLFHQGYLFIEHGFSQGAKVRELMYQNNFQNIETFQDLNHLDRVTKGQLLL